MSSTAKLAIAAAALCAATTLADDGRLVRDCTAAPVQRWQIKEVGGRKLRASFPNDNWWLAGSWKSCPDLEMFRHAVVRYATELGLTDYIRPIGKWSSPEERVALPRQHRWNKPTYTMDDFFAHNKQNLKSFETLMTRPDNLLFCQFHDARPPWFLTKDDYGADKEHFRRWREAHPNFIGFRVLGEFDGEIGQYRHNRGKTKHPEFQADIERVFKITDDPRADAENWLKTAYRQERMLHFGTNEFWPLFGINSAYAHRHAREGVNGVWFEAAMNATSGPWPVTGAFLRGAARQYQVPFGWYCAHYLGEAYSSKGEKNVAADGTRLTGEIEWRSRARPKAVNNKGAGRTFYNRQFNYGYFIGASLLEIENWTYSFYEDRPDGSLGPSRWAEDFNSVFERDRTLDRGVSYTPVAILKGIDENCVRHFYTCGNRDKFAMNAFFATLMPMEREEVLRISDRKNGDLGCLWNSKFGEMYDVLVADAKQPAGDFLAALSPYRAAFLVGWMDRESLDVQSLVGYVRGGGTLFVTADKLMEGYFPSDLAGVEFDGRKVAAAATFSDGHGGQIAFGEPYSLLAATRVDGAAPVIVDANGAAVAYSKDCGRGRVVTVTVPRFLPDSLVEPDPKKDVWTHYQAAITAGRQKFPLIDSLLSRVQDETMPCRVSGDVEWGLNRTASGWLFWCFNNKGVKKFSLEEERLDPAAAAHVEVAFKPEFGGSRLSFDVPPGGIVYRTVVPEPVDKTGELRFDAGRLLMERYPFKTLTVEDNLKGLREGMVPDYAVANVVKWLELMGVDMSEYRRTHKVAEAVAKPLREGFRVGYMLDISRDKVPTMDTLKTMVDVLAAAGFSEFQLYTEHTFAYAAHAEVWKDWSPMTAAEIRDLDDYAWEKGVRLIPNQNSFGHLAPWFRHAKYRDTIAEAPNGFTIDRPRLVDRPPRALCPTDPRSVEFLAGLYDELLPNFRHADEVNVGCDEVWDIFYKKGRSAAVAAEIGVPGLYMRHLLNVYDLLKRRGRRMAFWADMVLRDPELLDSVPRDVNALQWGYGSERSCRGYTCEFQGRCIALQRRGIPFTVCPQTFTCGCNGQFFDLPSSFGNVDLAVDCAAKYGAEGLLLTEWGDGGHCNPFLASLAQIVYTGLVCRGQPADAASVAARIDQIAGAKIGEHLMAIWSTRRKKGDRPDFAAIRRSLDAARAAAASAPGWVRNGLAVVDLHLRVHDARQAGAHVPAVLRDEYRRLWLEANRPGGLEASIAALGY